MPEIAARVPQRSRGRRVRRRVADQDPAAARGDRARGLCAGRHFRRLSARERRRGRRAISRRSRSIRSSPTSPGRSSLPAEIDGLPKLGFFPGSTIGNFVPRSATDLLRHFRDMLGTGAQLLIGMDRVKPVERLIAAYDDPRRRHRRVQPQPARPHQPRARRRHSRRRLPPRGALERHARRGSRCTWSRRATSSSPIDGQRFAFAEGASIHTENSHKYGPRGARAAAACRRLDPARRMDRPGRRFRADPRRGRSRKRFAP